jgi:hypothetical protein
MFLRIEFALNFKGIHTSWEKSQKFSKIMIYHGLHKCNFRSPYMHREVFKFLYNGQYGHLGKN